MIASKIAVFSFYISDKIDLHIKSGSIPSESSLILIKVLLLISHGFCINSEIYYIRNIIHNRYHPLLNILNYKLRQN